MPLPKDPDALLVELAARPPEERPALLVQSAGIFLVIVAVHGMKGVGLQSSVRQHLASSGGALATMAGLPPRGVPMPLDIDAEAVLFFAQHHPTRRDEAVGALFARVLEGVSSLHLEPAAEQVLGQVVFLASLLGIGVRHFAPSAKAAEVTGTIASQLAAATSLDAQRMLQRVRELL